MFFLLFYHMSEDKTKKIEGFEKSPSTALLKIFSHYSVQKVCFILQILRLVPEAFFFVFNYGFYTELKEE